MVNSRSTTIASCSFFLSLYLVITTIRTSLYSQFDLDHAPSPFQWHLTSLAVGSTPKTPPQCIIFLHIPKVGGRTVNTFLKGVVASTGMKMQTLYPKDLRELTLRQSDRLQAGERKYSPRDADRSSPRVPSRISRDRPLIHGKDDFTDNGTKTDSVPRGAREKSHRPLRQHRRSSVDENEILDNLSFNNTVTTGHFTTILFDKSLHSESCFKMTVLREPVSRAISAFFFHDHNYPRDVDSCLSTGDVDTSRKGTRPCRLQWQYSNDMTRRLAGLPDTKWLTFLEDQYLASTPNQTHLDRAKEKLLHDFDLVCFLDNLPMCARSIQNAFRIGQTVKNEAFNSSMMNSQPSSIYVTKSRPDNLDEETMDRFRAVNGLDIELYDWALSKFSRA